MLLQINFYCAESIETLSFTIALASLPHTPISQRLTLKHTSLGKYLFITKHMYTFNILYSGIFLGTCPS